MVREEDGRLVLWAPGPRLVLWAGLRTTAAELSFIAVEGCVPRKGFPMLDGVVLVVGMDFRPMPRLTP